MSLICPQCSQVNQEATVFCRACGYRFQGNEQEVDEDATVRPASLSSIPADADPSDTLKKPDSPPASQPAPAMVTPQPQVPGAPSNTPAYEQPAAATPVQPQGVYYSQPMPFVQGGYVPQAVPSAYGQYPPQGAYSPPAPVPASPSPLTTLQRGFVGRGAPVHHQSWLIENKQATPQTLAAAFIANLQKQNVMGVTVEPERLREHSTALEERDYVRVRYGASSVFVYLAPMGQNLYISRTSTIRQPLSRVRIAVLAILFLLMIIALIPAAAIAPSTTSDFNAFYNSVSVKGFFQYVFDGLLLFFLAALLRSLVFWMTDRDFLAVLRPNRLSDFSLDALSSIEQTTDKALRVTLQEAGLDAEAISQAQSKAPQQPLHRI